MTNVFTWVTDEVIDPLGTLVREAAASGITLLEKLAGVASAAIPPQPSKSPVVAGFEAGVQGVVDTALTSLLGPVPGVGETLAPAAVAEANALLAYLDSGANGLLDTLAARLKAKLAQYSSPPAAPPATSASA